MESHLNAAVEAARKAGNILIERFKSPKVRTKNIKDIVTDADIEAEKIIKEFLLNKYPDYGFIGEETENKQGKRIWVVDPIDGTRSFAFGIPYFSVVIALIENKETLLGVIYNPITNEMFTAIKGDGAFVNEKRIQPNNNVKKLSESTVGCAFRYHREELFKLEEKTNICMLTFSAALDICKVAQGRIDAAVYGLTKVYDHAASALIAQETGIKVTNFGKNTWSIFDMGVIAAKPNIHTELSALFTKPLDNLTDAERSHIDPDFKA